MNSEKEVFASLLRLTKTGSVHKDFIKKYARVSTEVLEQVLRKLSWAGLINIQQDSVEVSSIQRVNLAIHALKIGADYEKICKLLNWMEFETIAAKAFEANQFLVLKNLRFKNARNRREIDILGCREPFIVCVDCKQWQRGWSQGAIIKAVEAQTERTRIIADELHKYYQKAQLAKWRSATLIPLILSLIPGPFKFCNNVPVVPILQLQHFINEMPLEAHSLMHFRKKLIRINQELTNYFK